MQELGELFKVNLISNCYRIVKEVIRVGSADEFCDNHEQLSIQEQINYLIYLCNICTIKAVLRLND